VLRHDERDLRIRLDHREERIEEPAGDPEDDVHAFGLQVLEEDVDDARAGSS